MNIDKMSDLTAKDRTWLRRTLARHMRSSLVIPVLGASLIMAAPMIANAATIAVTNETELRNAINSADNGDTISFSNGITLSQDLPPIPKSVVIDGNGFLLNANGYEAFYVNAGTTPVVQELTINNGYRSIGGGSGGGIFSNANSGTPTSITLNGSTAFGSNGGYNGVVLDGNVELYALNTSNTISDGIILNGDTSVNVVDDSSGAGKNKNHSNSLTSDVIINDSDASVNIGGVLTTSNSGFGGINNSTINNTLTGDVTGASGVGGTVDIGSDISSKTTAVFGASTNTITNTLAGNVTMDGSSSEIILSNTSILDGSGSGNSGLGASINTVNNNLNGNVELTNGGEVILGGSDITVHSTTGVGGANTIRNTINGDVTVTDGDVNFRGGAFNTSQQSGITINTITNTINGDVIVNGIGNLNFDGDHRFDIINIASNQIDGYATLNGSSDSYVEGTHNSITEGLTLNTTTDDYIIYGGNEHNDVTKLIIGGSYYADVGTGPVLNQLTVDGTGVTVEANPYTNYNYYNNYQRSSDHGYDIDSGHVYVGAFGTATTANAQSITNVLDSNVTLNGTANTDFEGNNNYYNSGGMVILGGADNDLYNGGTVVNQITGTVDLHGGSRLHLGGDQFTGDNNVSNSITNQINGAVTADGNTYIAMWGENDIRLHNVIDNTLTLTDNALLHTEGVDNSITGGTTLNGKSVAQVGGSGGAHTPVSNLASDFILNDDSQLQLGGDYEYYNSVPGITNHIDGDVTLNDDASLKVLSGGSGGTNSALGSSNISGDLTLSNDNTFIVNAGEDNNITGLRVDGTNGANLNDAKVQVNLINNNLTFGQQYSLVEALNGRNGIFNPDVVTADYYGDPMYMPFLLWETGYTSDSAYLTLLTQFNNASQTDNQRRFGQYLDNLVSDSAPGGITDTPGDNDLYDTLQYLAFQNNPNALNDFMGDSYAAFDLAGYWNASRFSNRVAMHALQSRDSDWVQSFALNASQGLSGAGSQMSLVKQMLNSRPALQLAANSNAAMYDSSNAKNGVWGDIAGDWLSNDGDSSIGSPDFDLNSKSLVLGYQGGSQKFTWGIAGGYHDGNLDFNNRAASGDVDGWNVGLNGLWKGNSGVYLNGVLAYSKDSNSLKREDGLGLNKSDFGSHALSAQLELGKKFDHGKNINFTPYLSLLGMKYDRDSVRERGSGAGLNVGDASNSYFTSNLGVRLGKDFIDEDGSKRGGMMLGVSWQHQFSDVNFPVTAALQNAAPGSSFQVNGTPLSKNGVGVQLGGYGRLSENILGFLNYSGNFSSNQKVNSVTAGVEYQF